MSEETIFVDGLAYKSPHPNAPDFVIGGLSINIPKLKEFMEAHADGDWLNMDIKESKGGKMYIQLNTYKRGDKKDGETTDDTELDAVAKGDEKELNPDDIPF